MIKVRRCIAALLALGMLAASPRAAAEDGAVDEASTIGAATVATATEVAVHATADSVYATLDGSPIDGARLIGATTYLPMRAACEAVGYAVGWDASASAATASGADLELSVGRGASYLVANGRYIYLDGATARLIDGRMYLPARPLAKALGRSVEWVGATRSVHLTRGSGAIASGASFYRADDVYWLSRIISAEARGESLVGQIAVGAVVLNRVASGEFPNTICGVIFDRKWGVQFEPTMNGEIWREPTASSVIAAKLALDGANPVGSCLYFLNRATASSGWIPANRVYHSQIGAHSFYL